MFNPSPENDIVKKLKDSLKIDEEVVEPDTSVPEYTLEDKENIKHKRRHGVGYKIKERVVKSVEQVKLLNKFKGDSKKKTYKSQKSSIDRNKPNSEHKSEAESDDQSRLDLIFNNFKKKSK